MIDLHERARWEEATTDALPGQCWEYAAGLAVGGLQPWLAVVRQDGARMILPFHQRVHRGRTDIATLPGLSGATVIPKSGAPLRAFSDYARNQGWVCGYLQLCADNAGLNAPPPDRVARRNAYFLFDLKEWRFDTSIGHNLRKSLRRTGRDGANLVHDQDRLAGAFPALHAQSMAAHSAAPVFGADVLKAWSATPIVRYFGAEVDGVLQIALLCMCKGRRAEGLLTGATPAGRGLHSWMFWQAAEWFASQGYEQFNIGGYGTAGDGLHLMKQRLVSREVPMLSVRQVYDIAAYDQLCIDAGAKPDADYFPPYRQR